MGVTIKSTAGYLYLDSWVMANIIQLSTVEFCRRFLNKGNDPCGRQYDQMTQAARSVTANIAEGASRRQIEHLLDDFKAEGGFTENLTQERIATMKQTAASEGNPTCPVCGKPMIKRTAKKGHWQGQEFWSCTDYPNCRGTRRI